MVKTSKIAEKLREEIARKDLLIQNLMQQKVVYSKEDTTIKNEPKSQELEIPTNQAQQLILDIQLLQDNRTGSTYLFEDDDGSFAYCGSSVDILTRVPQHSNRSTSGNEKLFAWLQNKEEVKVRIVYTGNLYHTRVVESLILLLKSELNCSDINLNLVNIRHEAIASNYNEDEYVRIADDIEIRKNLPILKSSPGHDHLIAGLRQMILRSNTVIVPKKNLL